MGKRAIKGGWLEANAFRRQLGQMDIVWIVCIVLVCFKISRGTKSKARRHALTCGIMRLLCWRFTRAGCCTLCFSCAKSKCVNFLGCFFETMFKILQGNVCSKRLRISQVHGEVNPGYCSGHMVSPGNRT